MLQSVAELSGPCSYRFRKALARPVAAGVSPCSRRVRSWEGGVRGGRGCVHLKGSAPGHGPSPLGSKCSSTRLSFPLLFLYIVFEGSLMDFFFILLFFGSILSSFWCHFSDFLRMGGICENVGFTIVKQWFLRVRGVPDRSFSLMFFKC